MIKYIEEILEAIGLYKLNNAFDELKTIETFGELGLKLSELITIMIRYPTIPIIGIILMLGTMYIIVRISTNPLKGPDKKIKFKSTTEEQN